jgi:ribosome-associated translation inhibitor RaiA
MQIQFNSDKNVILAEEQIVYLTSTITEELSRFSTQITRLEIHLSDVDGKKDGFNDKRCMVEARIAGMKPIAVTDHANTPEQAVFGASEKLKTSLETLTGRIKEH